MSRPPERPDEAALDPAEEAAAEALLRALEPPTDREAPAELLESLERWLAVAIVELPSVADEEAASQLGVIADELEPLGDGRYALAVEVAADAAGEPDGRALRSWIERLGAEVDTRRGARAAVVVRRGARGANAILGSGPEAAAGLYRAAVAAGVTGVVIDARVHAAMGGPAEPLADGLLLALRRRSHGEPEGRAARPPLEPATPEAPATGRGRQPRGGSESEASGQRASDAPVAPAASTPPPMVGEPARRRGRRRGWWAASLAAAAAVVVLLVVPGLRHRGEPPPAYIYVAGQRATGTILRSPGETRYRESDLLSVTVEAPAGGYVSLLLLDSRDRLVFTEPRYLNDPRSPVRERFELDDVPGRERFVAVVSRRPLPDLPRMVAAVNGVSAATRDGRLERLRATLSEHLPPESFTIVSSAEILHAP